MSKALPWVLNLAGGSGGGGTTYTAGTGIEITSENVINNTIDSYDELNDRPSINGITLTGNKTSSDLNILADINYYVQHSSNTVVFEKTIEHSSWGGGNLYNVYDSALGDNFADYWRIFLNECLNTGLQNRYNYIRMCLTVHGANSQQVLHFIYSGNDFNNKYPTGNIYGMNIIEQHEYKYGVSTCRMYIDTVGWKDQNNQYIRLQLNNVSNSKLTALATNNTWEYTPTSDYHPATKKYVDDHAGGGDPSFLPLDITYTEQLQGLILVQVNVAFTSNSHDNLLAILNVKVKGQECLGYSTHDQQSWIRTCIYNLTETANTDNYIAFTLGAVVPYLPLRSYSSGALNTKPRIRVSATIYVKKSEWTAGEILEIYDDSACTNPMSTSTWLGKDEVNECVIPSTGISMTGFMNQCIGYDSSKRQYLTHDPGSGNMTWVDIT